MLEHYFCRTNGNPARRPVRIWCLPHGEHGCHSWISSFHVDDSYHREYLWLGDGRMAGFAPQSLCLRCGRLLVLVVAIVIIGVGLRIVA
jgi:hypothetical protein